MSNVLRSMWERGWSFIKKAGTIILLSTIFVWFTTYFGFVDGTFRMLSEEEIDYSILAAIGSVLAWVFKPLAGATGRRLSLPSPVWSPRRTSLVLWASCTAAETAPCIRPCQCFQRHYRLFLPGVQPAVRPLLRGYRRHQA